MKNLANGFFALHQNNIIHRDLKLENIFVKFPKEKPKDKSEQLEYFIKSTYLIGDFGLAK